MKVVMEMERRRWGEQKDNQGDCKKDKEESEAGELFIILARLISETSIAFLSSLRGSY